MKLVPYLLFNGNAEEATTFYAEIFGGKITALQRFSDNPNIPVDADYKNKILHGRLDLLDNQLYFSDGFKETPTKAGNNFSLTMEFDDLMFIEAVYKRLCIGATIQMELQDTFWGAKYAKLTDRFGVHWDLNYQYPEDDH